MCAQGWASQQLPLRPPVLDRPARIVDQPENSFMLGLARAGDRLVAAGDLGRILLSDDNGKSWRQASVPVSVLLTDIGFANDHVGWAIGHLGVVLKTEDGGEHWRLQLDGIAAAQLVLDATRARLKGKSEDEVGVQLRRAELLVSDGPDKPFTALDVRSEQEVVVLGAYGYAVQTVDGGSSWQPIIDHFENPMGLHYYGVDLSPKVSFAVGEQGMLLRSRDALYFGRVDQPYEGTFFGGVHFAEQGYIAYGMRGNIVATHDGGDSWKLISNRVPSSIQAGALLNDGRVLLVAESGRMLLSRDEGQTFNVLASRTQPAADLLQLGQEEVLVAGPLGLKHVTLVEEGMSYGD